MITKRNLVIAVLCTFCLTFTLFAIVPAGSNYKTSGIGEYDPWLDSNDDGRINILECITLAGAFGTNGTPINKTALLLELQSRVVALETRMPKKGYISVPPAAFTPQFTTFSYEKYPGYIRGAGGFLAPVQLPNGVIVTNMSVSLIDYSATGLIQVGLIRAHVRAENWMAYVVTDYAGAPGQMTLFDDTIDSAQVDNQNYYYTLKLYFTYETNDLILDSVFIEYEYP